MLIEAKAEAPPMVSIDDFLAVVEDLCPECSKRIKHVLIQRLAMKAIPPPLPRNSMGRILTELLEAIAEDHGYTVDAIRERNNDKEMVEARRDFAQQARARGYSMPAIGRALNRHHATIIHLLKKSKGGTHVKP